MKRKIITSLFLIFINLNNFSFADNDHENVNLYISSLINEVMELLQNKDNNTSRESLAKLLNGNVDYEKMSKFVLGNHRRSIDPNKISEFNKAYRKYVDFYFINNFESLKSSKLKLSSLVLVDEGEYLAKIEVGDGFNTPVIKIDFMIKRYDDKFRIFDIIFEGVSFISSQRAEYNSVISQKGIDYIIEYLNANSSKNINKQGAYNMKKIEVYTKDYCGYCAKAKAFLAQKNVSFVEIDITNKPEVLEKISKISEIKTVPQIFVDNVFVSDYSNLLALEKNNQFDAIFLSK